MIILVSSNLLTFLFSSGNLFSNSISLHPELQDGIGRILSISEKMFLSGLGFSNVEKFTAIVNDN